MFGVTSAPEKYQQIIRDLLRGCAGIANIENFLIVHGGGVEEHDKHLFAVLDRQQGGGMWRVISYASRSLTWNDATAK